MNKIVTPLWIFVFEDYGVVTVQPSRIEPAALDEVVETLKKRSKAHYLVEVEIPMIP